VGLHMLKINDEIDLQDGRFRVVKINECRVACVPSSRTKVKMTDRHGKVHEFSAEGRMINISPGYEGRAYRDGVKIHVMPKEKFQKAKAQRV
jgi:hypothetical protein